MEMPVARDLYQQITDRVIAKLEAGTKPWVQPYRSAKIKLPCNAVSNRPYSGINILLYWESIAKGYSRPRFLTFKQAKALGGNVRRGEKGTELFFFKPMASKDKTTGEDKKWLLLRVYNVFNVAQCDHLPDHIMTGPIGDDDVMNPDQRDSVADRFITSTGADVRELGTRQFPCYVPSLDYIDTPPFRDYKGAQNFYVTMFHELAHWTGHQTRLDRDLKPRFKTAAYAAEELIAELTAAFLSAEFGYDMIDDNASYIATWLKLLKEDPKAIVTAASRAQQAADYLRGKALADEPEEEMEAA
jgi:antirestriction protein ArdC